MDIISRLNSFVDYLGLSSSQFADRIGVPRPSMSQILNGRNRKISNELITKIHEQFANLNILWLLFGNGSMLTEDVSEQNATANNEKMHLFDGGTLHVDPSATYNLSPRRNQQQPPLTDSIPTPDAESNNGTLTAAAVATGEDKSKTRSDEDVIHEEFENIESNVLENANNTQTITAKNANANTLRTEERPQKKSEDVFANANTNTPHDNKNYPLEITPNFNRNKKIVSIMVMYSDKTYSIFKEDQADD